MRRHCENIELSMLQAGYTELCERMLASEIDLALFVETPELNERLHRWPLFSERYMLLCGPDHKFKDRDMVAVQDLAGECVLVHADAACPLRRYLEAICEQHGVQPRRRHLGSSQEQIAEMVCASLGVSVAGERSPDSPMLLRRPIAADPDRRTIVLTTVAGRLLGPTPSLFLKLMRARGWRAEDNPSMAVAA
jgi:DNA-binding transcriptional LysR family regulator